MTVDVSSSDGEDKRPHFVILAAGLLVFGIVLAALLGTALLSISHAPAPHRVAFAYIGPVKDAAQLQSATGTALDVQRVADVATAQAKIEHLDVYGALINNGGRPHLLVATAAAPQVASLLRTIASSLPGTPIVTDVVPLPVHDSAGGSIAVLVQVTVLAGTIGAIGLGLVIPRYRANFTRREVPVIFLIVFAVVVGVIVAAVAHSFGVGTEAGFWPLALALSLLNLAVTATVSALVAVVGQAGTAAGGILYFLLGVPISGGATALPLLAPGWRDFGQALPPGAAATLVRRILYFHSSGIGHSVTVLAIYAATGAVVLVVVNALEQRSVRRHHGRHERTGVWKPVLVSDLTR